MNQLFENAIGELKAKNISLELIRQLSSGKEAIIYLVKQRYRLFALKVYKDYSTRSFKINSDYLDGKYIRNPSQQKAMERKNRYGKELRHRLWVKREFYMLKKLYSNKVDVPEPIELTNNAILMEYIGNINQPAPLLKYAKLSRVKVDFVYNMIVQDINKMYEAGIVHGDLSPFNILYWKDKPYIIDFPQSVDIRNNPNAATILERDKLNINKWYKQVSVEKV